jgi:hypothetical protein
MLLEEIRFVVLEHVHLPSVSVSIMKPLESLQLYLVIKNITSRQFNNVEKYV